MNTMETVAYRAAFVLLVVGGAAFAGYYFTKPKPVVETYKPETVQSDGSLIVERKPDAKAKPKTAIPKKAKVERTGEFTVLGKTPEANLKPGSTCVACPPVTINTTLVRLDDGSKRVVVKSPDGIVLSAVDIPVETAAPPPEPKRWAAGLAYNPTMQTGGIWIERDMYRVRVGSDIMQTRLAVGGPTKLAVMFRIGVTW